MYQEIEILDSIPDESVVRRYMNFSKFISLLETSRLFFPSLELLAHEDKFEGLFNLVDHPIPQLVGQVDNNFQRNYRRHCFVNCWSYNNSESFALWKIYLGSSDDGIAIESDFSHLKNSFNSFEEDIHIGRVRYSDGSYMGSRFFTCTTKRSPFSYEQEIRVIYENVPINPETERQDVSIEPQQSGYSIPIDLNTLLGRVVISPSSAAWFHELVRSVLNRYGFSTVEVVPSMLATEPI